MTSTLLIIISSLYTNATLLITKSIFLILFKKIVSHLINTIFLVSFYMNHSNKSNIICTQNIFLLSLLDSLGSNIMILTICNFILHCLILLSCKQITSLLFTHIFPTSNNIYSCILIQGLPATLDIFIAILHKTLKIKYCKCPNSVYITLLYISNAIVIVYFVLKYLLHSSLSSIDTYLVFTYLLHSPYLFINAFVTFILYLKDPLFKHYPYYPNKNNKFSSQKKCMILIYK